MSEFNKYSTDGGATFIDVEDANAVNKTVYSVTGGYNIAQINNIFPQTLNNMTYTKNADDSITFSGTPSGYTELGTHRAFIDYTKKYKLSGLKNCVNVGWAEVKIYNNNDTLLGSIASPNNNNDQLCDFSSYTTASYVIIIIKRLANDIACSGTGYVKFTPEEVGYDYPYQPYSLPNSELTKNKVNNSVVAPIENDTTASKGYAIGQGFIRGIYYCYAIKNITQGETLTKDVNFKSRDIGQMITSAMCGDQFVIPQVSNIDLDDYITPISLSWSGGDASTISHLPPSFSASGFLQVIRTWGGYARQILYARDDVTIYTRRYTGSWGNWYSLNLTQAQ